MDGVSLALPPIAFLIFTLIAYILFGLGSMVAPKYDKKGGKPEPYLCGQDIELGVLVPGYWQFFPVAIIFTILHVTVFILALMPSAAIFYALIYLVIVGASAGVLISEIDLKIPPKERALAKLQRGSKVADAGIPTGGSSTQTLE